MSRATTGFSLCPLGAAWTAMGSISTLRIVLLSTPHSQGRREVERWGAWMAFRYPPSVFATG